MTPDEVRDALKPFNLVAVAADLGMDYVTVWRFARGKTRNPTWEMVNTLAEYVKGKR
jgi:DNA-directed RNA polymerase specialized sigma54-like protein